MENQVAITLRNCGVKDVRENIFTPDNMKWIHNIMKSLNMNDALETYPLTVEDNIELVELFKTISISRFFAQLRASLFQGNFCSSRIRLDIKTSSRSCSKLNDVFFVIEIVTANGSSIIRLRSSMLDKLIQEMDVALHEMRKLSSKHIQASV